MSLSQKLTESRDNYWYSTFILLLLNCAIFKTGAEPEIRCWIITLCWAITFIIIVGFFLQEINRKTVKTALNGDNSAIVFAGPLVKVHSHQHTCMSGSVVCRYHSGHHCFREPGSSGLCRHTSHILQTLPQRPGWGDTCTQTCMHKPRLTSKMCMETRKF